MDGMPELPGLWSLTPWGALVGLLVFFGLSVIRGWFIPKSTHERELNQANIRGDEWKETAKSLEAVNAEIRKQNGELIEANKVVESVLRAASPPSAFGDSDSNFRGPS